MGAGRLEKREGVAVMAIQRGDPILRQMAEGAANIRQPYPPMPEALLNAYYQAVWPEYEGQPIEIEWLQFVPDGPVFAITRWPRMVMLVGFEEDRQ